MSLAQLSKTIAASYPTHPDQAGMIYTDTYSALEREIKKLSSAYEEAPDYAKVAELTVQLLQDGYPNLLVFSYLSLALCQLYRWPGFGESVAILHQRLATQWEQMSPPIARSKGRIAALQWLVERWQRFLDQNPLTGLGVDFINRTAEHLRAIDTLLNTYYPDQFTLAGLLTPFTEQQKRQQAEAAQRALKDAAAQQEQERQAAQQAFTETLEAHAEPIAPEAFFDNLNTVELFASASKRLLAEHLEQLRTSPFDVAHYKLARAVLWWPYTFSEQELLNLIDSQGLDWQAYSAALLLKAKQQYLDALIAFEQLFHRHPFYLELQRHIIDCLTHLSADPRVLALLKSEVKLLCQGYPLLLEARINNEITLLDTHNQAYFEVLPKADEPAQNTVTAD